MEDADLGTWLASGIPLLFQTLLFTELGEDSSSLGDHDINLGIEGQRVFEGRSKVGESVDCLFR